MLEEKVRETDREKRDMEERIRVLEKEAAEYKVKWTIADEQLRTMKTDY